MDSLSATAAKHVGALKLLHAQKALEDNLTRLAASDLTDEQKKEYLLQHSTLHGVKVKLSESLGYRAILPVVPGSGTDITNKSDLPS